MMLTHHDSDTLNFWELDPGSWSAADCDAFVQYAAFGEIRYP